MNRRDLLIQSETLIGAGTLSMPEMAGVAVDTTYSELAKRFEYILDYVPVCLATQEPAYLIVLEGHLQDEEHETWQAGEYWDPLGEDAQEVWKITLESLEGALRRKYVEIANSE